MDTTLHSRWAQGGAKLVALAADFPAERYDFRPTPDIRSFADQLRHVAFWNHHVGQTLRGEPADGESNALPRESFPDKPSVLAALRESFEDVSRTLLSASDVSGDALHALVVPFLEHNGEHYGQLVMYYRVSGLVPPASR